MAYLGTGISPTIPSSIDHGAEKRHLAVMTSISLNQVIITPRDITTNDPNPMDAPYLTMHGAHFLSHAGSSVRGVPIAG